jgi:hypothetical protein
MNEASLLREPPLGIEQIARLQRAIVVPAGQPPTGLGPSEFPITRAVLDRIGLGLEPTNRFIFSERPSLEELERWILKQLGGAIDAETIADANAIAAGNEGPGLAARRAEIESAEPALSAAELAFWDEHGYLILRDAAPAEACAGLRGAIFERLGADPADPDSWYRSQLHEGIMVQMFQAPGIREIHASTRVRKAFAQLAGTADLVMTSDRCGFNPPVRADRPYTGPRLHFDLPSFARPVATHLQGILYLTDTSESQGAFRCVAGFHHRIDDWLRALPPGGDPNLQDLEALGPVSIAASGGDLIIWDARLPHGPQANLASQPRVVHYLTMYPRPLPARD